MLCFVFGCVFASAVPDFVPDSVSVFVFRSVSWLFSIKCAVPVLFELCFAEELVLFYGVTNLAFGEPYAVLFVEPEAQLFPAGFGGDCGSPEGYHRHEHRINHAKQPFSNLLLGESRGVLGNPASGRGRSPRSVYRRRPDPGPWRRGPD